MKLIVGILVMACAVAISAVAAYFSVVGLAALFTAALIPVAIMGIVLEGSKLVAAGWLHANWKNPHVTKWHKGYLTAAVVSLMLITSMGIYGYLMKAHLEQTAPTSAIQVDIDHRQTQIDQLVIQRDQLIKQQTAINSTISGYLEGGKASGASQFMRQQRGEQSRLETRITALNDQITEANVALAPFKKQIAGAEVELGQWKYLARALNLKNPEAAIDLLIKLLMFAFDPLAVVMMISGTITLGEWSRARRLHPDLEGKATLIEDLPELAPEVEENNNETEENISEEDNVQENVGEDDQTKKDEGEIDPTSEFMKRHRGALADIQPDDFGTDVTTMPNDEFISTLSSPVMKINPGAWLQLNPAPDAAAPAFTGKIDTYWTGPVPPEPIVPPAVNMTTRGDLPTDATSRLLSPSEIASMMVSATKPGIAGHDSDTSGHQPDILSDENPNNHWVSGDEPDTNQPHPDIAGHLSDMDQADPDLERVNDRDILLALLENNPGLLNEVVDAIEAERAAKIPEKPVREWLERKKEPKTDD
jgi:hypothetical protein